MDKDKQDVVTTSENEVRLAEELAAMKAERDSLQTKLVESNNKLLAALTQPVERTEVKVLETPKPFELKDIKF